MKSNPQDQKTELCLLCDKINSGEAEEVHKMGIFSFVPGHPMTEGHRIFVPRDHVVNPRLSSGITGLVMSGIIAWAESRNEDYDIVLSQGPSYSTTTDHMHVHYIPKVFRKSGIANMEAWVVWEELRILSERLVVEELEKEAPPEQKKFMDHYIQRNEPESGSLKDLVQKMAVPEISFYTPTLDSYPRGDE